MISKRTKSEWNSDTVAIMIILQAIEIDFGCHEKGVKFVSLLHVF